ncbi:MAG: chloride channel protein [Ruminococcaceae bacterium]|nr:chloride channel protein [Oscillospiraceae bacterium]
MKSLNLLIKNFKTPHEYFLVFLKWLALGTLTGVTGGILGSLFTMSIHYVTDIRSKHDWLIYLLPLGGLAIVLIYRLCRVKSVGTNEVFDAIRSEKNVPRLLLPAIFLGSVITHLFGGSAGREGAALQIGGSMAATYGKLLKLNEKNRHIFLMCGMSAVFSSVFGTPLTATIFSIEVVSVGYLYSSALLPCLVSSLSAYFVSLKFGITPERFAIKHLPDFEFKTIMLIFTVAIVSAIVGILFCKAMHLSAHLFKKYFKNEYLRITVGGIIIILLTLIVNSTDYNGGGINIIENIFHNSEVKYEAFLLKIIFTVITIGSGYKGGEIVPTMFIGATLGGSIASLLGLSVPFGAALGISALFAAVTNCPIATLLLSLELFGEEGLLFYVLSAFISFLISGYSSLYTGQKLIFSKLCDEKIEINGK